MKSNFYHKRVIVTNSGRDCIMLCMSIALLFNGLDIPFVSKPLFLFFTFMALHIAFVQIRHKLHKNKREKIKNSIQA